MGSLAGPSLASQFLVHIKEFSILTSWPFWRRISFFRVLREGQIWQQWKLPGNSHVFNFLIFLPLLPSSSPLHSHPQRKELILQSTSSATCFHSPGQVDGPLLWSPFRVWREHLKVTCDPVQKQRIGTLKVPRVPDYYRKFTSRCSPSNPSGSNLLRNPGGSVSVLDNKTQSPMGATLELQNICPI